MKPTVFIHTNAQQFMGAKVSEYSIRKYSKNLDKFEVKILHLDDHPFLKNREGELYLREGRRVAWRSSDLQSFTPLRFLPPQVMGYSGRAVVIDPDVFALADIYELLSRDMNGKAIVCRKIPPADGKPGYHASSVMLLDCSKLKHWRWEEAIEKMFSFQCDYREWMSLLLEPEDAIGSLEEVWNHFDTLDERTKMLHNTARVTQPWKTGLPIDFMPKKPASNGGRIGPRLLLKKAKSLLRFKLKRTERYRPHPDPKQEKFFFDLLRECLEENIVSEHFLREEISRKHLRPDALSLIRDRSHL